MLPLIFACFNKEERMRFYKNISERKVMVGQSGTGGLITIHPGQTLPLATKENKHLAGLCMQGTLEYINDDEEDRLIKHLTQSLKPMFDNMEARLMSVIKSKLTGRDVPTEYFNTPLPEEEVANIKEVANILSTVKEINIGEMLETVKDVVIEDEVITEDYFIDEEQDIDDDDDTEEDNFGPIKGTDEWNELSRSEKSKITKARNAAKR